MPRLYDSFLFCFLFLLAKLFAISEAKKMDEENAFFQRQMIEAQQKLTENKRKQRSIRSSSNQPLCTISLICCSHNIVVTDTSKRNDFDDLNFNSLQIHDVDD